MKQSCWTIPFFEASTPERLIAGIAAGLTLWIDAGDCARCVGGFGVYAGKGGEAEAVIRFPQHP